MLLWNMYRKSYKVCFITNVTANFAVMYSLGIYMYIVRIAAEYEFSVILLVLFGAGRFRY